MSHDIQQWIVEIKALQQQLADLQRDRDAALDSAGNWRQLYNTEAQQRRDEAKLSHQMIESLKAEIQKLKTDRAQAPDEEADEDAIASEVAQLQTEELKDRLTEALIERDRLARALKSEQVAHAQTREKLTTALGDAVDVLAIVKKRETHAEAAKPAEAEVLPPPPAKLPGAAQTIPGLPGSSSPLADLPGFVKTPSLKLPPTRPAPPRS
jgi:hypothetical protein